MPFSTLVSVNDKDKRISYLPRKEINLIQYINNFGSIRAYISAKTYNQDKVLELLKNAGFIINLTEEISYYLKDTDIKSAIDFKKYKLAVILSFTLNEMILFYNPRYIVFIPTVYQNFRCWKTINFNDRVNMDTTEFCNDYDLWIRTFNHIVSKYPSDYIKIIGEIKNKRDFIKVLDNLAPTLEYGIKDDKIFIVVNDYIKWLNN